MITREITIKNKEHELKFVFFKVYHMNDFKEKDFLKTFVLHMIIFVDDYYFKEGELPIDDNAEEEKYHETNVYNHLISDMMKILMRKYKKDETFSFLNEFDKFIKDGLKKNKIVDDMLLSIKVKYNI